MQIGLSYIVLGGVIFGFEKTLRWVEGFSNEKPYSVVIPTELNYTCLGLQDLQ